MSEGTWDRSTSEIKNPRKWAIALEKAESKKRFTPKERLAVSCIVCGKKNCDSDDCWSIVVAGRPLLKESAMDKITQGLYARYR